MQLNTNIPLQAQTVDFQPMMNTMLQMRQEKRAQSLADLTLSQAEKKAKKDEDIRRIVSQNAQNPKMTYNALMARGFTDAANKFSQAYQERQKSLRDEQKAAFDIKRGMAIEARERENFYQAGMDRLAKQYSNLPSINESKTARADFYTNRIAPFIKEHKGQYPEGTFDAFKDRELNARAASQINQASKGKSQSMWMEDPDDPSKQLKWVFDPNTGETTPQVNPSTGKQFRRSKPKTGSDFDSKLNLFLLKHKMETEGRNAPAFKEIDKQFGKEYAEFFASGGIGDANKNIKQLEGVLKSLEGYKDPKTGKFVEGVEASGAITGLIPKVVRDLGMPEGAALQDAVEDIVQRNLRLILGAQFTEKEGARLIERAYNPRQPEKENIKRLKRLMEQMKTALNSKVKAGKYLQEHGTLYGYDGIDDLYMSTDSFDLDEPASLDPYDESNVRSLLRRKK